MGDDYDNCCPLCITPFNEQDRQFRPCQVCSFRMCMWCWHTIVTLSDHDNGTCPQCRTPFDLESIRKQKMYTSNSNGAASRPKRKSVPARAALTEVVVMDRKLVAVRNIPAILIECNSTPISCDEGGGVASIDDRWAAITQHFLFGQYGRIVGAVVSKAPTQTADPNAPENVAIRAVGGLYNAAIRFSTVEESLQCVRSVEGSVLCGVTLSCTLIPSKYCSHFLLKTLCSKKMCVDLHHEVTDKASWVKGATASALPLLGTASLAKVPPLEREEFAVGSDGLRASVLRRAECWVKRTRAATARSLFSLAPFPEGEGGSDGTPLRGTQAEESNGTISPLLMATPSSIWMSRESSTPIAAAGGGAFSITGGAAVVAGRGSSAAPTAAPDAVVTLCRNVSLTIQTSEWVERQARRAKSKGSHSAHATADNSLSAALLPNGLPPNVPGWELGLTLPFAKKRQS